MPRPVQKQPATVAAAVAGAPLPPLKSFRRGRPLGTYQQKSMERAAWIIQASQERAALVLTGVMTDSKAPLELRVKCAQSLLNRGGFPERADLHFTGAVVAGSPQDFQAALRQALIDFDARKDKYVVTATDAEILGEMNGNGHQANAEAGEAGHGGDADGGGGGQTDGSPASP